jgi:hypothetical protein
MAKMKDLLISVLEDYENRVPVTVIAAQYDMSVEEVLRIIEEWGCAIDFDMDSPAKA